MRFIHTADWHLGQTLHGHDRTDEQFERVAHLLNLARTHEADALLVAGDVFEASKLKDRRRLPLLTQRLADLLRPHLEAGLHVMLLPGNHDDRDHFAMMHSLLGLTGQAAQRLVVAHNRRFMNIRGVRFALVPYPTREKLLKDYAPTAGGPKRNADLGARLADYLRSVASELAGHDGPAVLASHIAVKGVTTPQQFKIGFDSQLCLGSGDLPNVHNLAYIALGDIHQPQQIKHGIPCHYSGSPDRHDFGEADDEKCALLVEVPDAVPQQGYATVTRLPLEVTQFLTFKDLKPNDIELLSQHHSELDHAFVRAELHCDATTYPRLKKQLAAMCRLCDLSLISPDEATASVVRIPDPYDFRTTALGYLKEQHGEAEDFDELLVRAVRLIEQVEA